MAARRNTRRTSNNQQKLSNNQIAVLSVVAILVSSFGTFMLLDAGLVNITGAQTLDNGTVTLTVTGAAGCALNNLAGGDDNTSVAFSAAIGTTVSTTGGDATDGTLVVNNTGNVLINVSINSTNTSTGGFYGGSSVASDYQVSAGHLCEVNGDETVGITQTYTDTSTTHASLVRDFGFTNGNDSCSIEFQLHVPVDEPVGTKLDKININCTSGGEGGA